MCPPKSSMPGDLCSSAGSCVSASRSASCSDWEKMVDMGASG